MTNVAISRATMVATLDRRFWLVAGVGSAIALFVLGVPTAVLPNPFFVRMTPVHALDIAFWLASSPLIGLTLATFVARPPQRAVDPHSGVGSGPTSLGGVGAFLAIGCPICNKIVVGLLGVSGAMTVFAPIQPVIGLVSVGLLAGTLGYRLRQRAIGCPRCAGAKHAGSGYAAGDILRGSIPIRSTEVPMQLHILESTPDSVRAGYECPCGCRPSVTYERAAARVHDGCCCGNEFAVGPQATTALDAKPGYRAESTSFGAPWGETIAAAWLIGPSVHAEESPDHDHGDGPAAAHTHDHEAHDEGPEAATELDPVCGMTVDARAAEAKGLRSTYKEHDYYFCGRGCKLDFDEDPGRYLDPSYTPSM